MRRLRDLAARLEVDATWRWVLGIWLVANLASLVGRPLNHDVGYHIHAATRLVEGARLYVDIFEINPPIIFYLNQIPAHFAQWTGLSDILTFHVWVALLALVAIALTAHILARVDGLPVLLRRLLVLVLIYHFFIFEPRAIGQREYYFVIFFMPYLAAAFLVLRGGRLPLWGCFAVALPFAVATAQKPYFLLPFVLIELTVCLQRRSLAPLFRRENWIVGLTMLALVALSLTLHPEFLSDMLPMVMGTYNAFDQNLIVLTYNGRFLRLLVAFFGTTASAYVHDPIRQGGLYSKWMRSYIEALRTHAADQPAFALTSSIYLPFPPVPLAGSRWPYRYNHLWPLPNFYRSDDPGAGEAAYRAPAAQGALERRFFETVIEDLTRTPPRLVAVETQRYKQGFGYLGFDFVEYYSLDPRFAELWRNYVLLEDLGPVELYLYQPETTAALP